MKKFRMIGFVVLAAAALPVVALADHGKVGLWSITTKMAMANMPQIPPEQLAKMQAMGIHMPGGNTMTMQHCMSAQEVASNAPPQLQHNKDCNMQNMSMSGGTFTADMVCSGDEMQGNGHFTVHYDGDTHFVGKTTFTGTAHGHPVNTSNEMEGTWVSADCGGVTH